MTANITISLNIVGLFKIISGIADKRLLIRGRGRGPRPADLNIHNNVVVLVVV